MKSLFKTFYLGVALLGMTLQAYSLTSVLDKGLRKFHLWLILFELIGNETRENIHATVRRGSMPCVR